MEQLLATKERYAKFVPAPAEVDAFIVPKGSRQNLKLKLPRLNDSYEKNPEIFINVLVNTLTLNDINVDLWRAYLGFALEGTSDVVCKVD